MFQPPLNPHVRIVDEQGRPTPEFIRWWQSNRDATGDATLDTALKVSAALDKIGGAQGAILYRDSSNWNVLAPGVAGRVLQTGGPGANPSWAVAGGGTFLSLTDTPSSYTGEGGKTVAVKVDETGLEFVAGGGSAYQQILDLDNFNIPLAASFGVNLDMPSASATITDTASGIQIASTSTVEARRTIRAKTVPVGWRSVVFGMDFADPAAGGIHASPGLVLWRTGAAEFVTVGLGTDGANLVTTRILRWNATTGAFVASIVGTLATFGERVFYKIVDHVGKTDMSVYHSPDGVAWTLVNTSGSIESALGGAPTHFGISSARADTVTFRMYLDGDIHP